MDNMNEITLIESLQVMDFFYDNQQCRGFYWVKDLDDLKDIPYHAYIRIALEKAKKYNADAVYFRLFNDSRPPIPQIYIFDCTNRTWDEQYITEIHRKIWSSCQVPLFYIFTKTDIKIFNGIKQPNLSANKFHLNVLEQIILADYINRNIQKNTKELIEKFSAKNIDNGSFFEKEEFKNEFSSKNSAYESLILELRNIRREIINKKILPKELAHKLLVMSILIKYLEERKDNNNYSVFPRKNQERRCITKNEKQVFEYDFFSKYDPDAVEFIDVLKNNGDIVGLFNDLSIHFNGEVFKLTSNEQQLLREQKYDRFAEFLEGKTAANGQLSLWKRYSFEDLPVELISNIYEEFIEDRNAGVVYTPPFLVNFLSDEVLPLTDDETNIKILDPACGSGIFLVQAYKRLIYRWRSKNNWVNPDLYVLKKLLSKIFGIDIEPDSIRLTMFSLTLALCEELSPQVIWDDLKFDNLKGKNLFDHDFFDLTKGKTIPVDFDVIIGNPPFNIKKTEAFNDYTDEQKRKNAGKVNIPKKNPALAFLEKSMELCKPDGKLCLILPSGPFLYNLNSFNFRRQFLCTYNLKFIIDFSHLSRFLFGQGRGDHPTLAVFVINEAPKEKDILHVTIRKTKSIKEKIWFETDKYDFHYVPRKIALSNSKADKLIWKSNFLGGGRIFFLAKRLADMPTLQDFIDKQNQWIYNEGLIAGDEKKGNEVEFLSGKKCLRTEAFIKDGIDFDNLEYLNQKKFISPKCSELYQPPLVLIKEVIDNDSMLIEFVEKAIIYKDKIVGIHAPLEDKNKLLEIVTKIKGKRLYPFYSAIYSGQLLLSKSSAILKDDIDNLPYPDFDIKLSHLDKILIDDTIKYFFPFKRQHGIITEAEKVITDKNNEILEQYSDIFLKILNSVYKEYKAAKYLLTGNHIIYPFYYGDASGIPTSADDLEQHLNKLLVAEYPSANLRSIRIMTIYDKNVIYFIKPNQVRYWLRSIAIRDADETFADLVDKEYNL